MTGLKPRRSFPSLKRGLQKLHFDLLSIHSFVQPDLAYYPTELTTLERLVLTLEDRRFFRHMGVDWIRLVRELWRLVTFRSHGGASTIDMQFVRTATGYRQRSMSRKLYEMLLSYLIQHRYPKIVVLRSYMQAAYFGTGLRGAETASLAVFGKYSWQLDVNEAARLAAMLVFPRPRNPSATWERKWLRRSNYIESVYVGRKESLDKLENRIFR